MTARKNLHKHLLEGRHRDITLNKTLGRSLAFIAGAINAGGFMVVAQYTSHMTGIISLAADNIALNQWALAAALLFYIVCFIFGAAVTTILVIWGKNKNLHSRYALPLAIEALLLIVFGISGNEHAVSSFYTISLLCFLMGLQNAVITKITDTSIRTTHITGMTTDIGIEIGRIISSRGVGKILYNKEKIMLHLSIISLFLLGGVIGAYGFKYMGFVFVLPLAAYLLLLAFFPIRRDISINNYLHRRRSRES